MPGKHAPGSPASFYVSVARAAGGALVVLAIVAVIAIAATGTNKKPAGTTTPPVAAVSNSTVASPSPSLSVTSSPTPVPAKVTVNVYNGTTKNGLARSFASSLAKDGYIIKTVATAAAHQAVTTIYYRPGAKAAAEALLAAHPELGKIQAATSGTPTNAMLTVILGDDYKAA